MLFHSSDVFIKVQNNQNKEKIVQFFFTVLPIYTDYCFGGEILKTFKWGKKQQQKKTCKITALNVRKKAGADQQKSVFFSMVRSYSDQRIKLLIS